MHGQTGPILIRLFGTNSRPYIIKDLLYKEEGVLGMRVHP